MVYFELSWVSTVAFSLNSVSLEGCKLTWVECLFHLSFSAENHPFAFQHLVWILGLKPGVGGALKPGRAVEGPSTVSMIVHFIVNDYAVFSVATYKIIICLFSRFWPQQLWRIYQLYPTYFRGFLKAHSKKSYPIIKIMYVYQTWLCFDSCYFSGTLMMCLYIT